MKRFYRTYISPLFFTTRFFTGVVLVVLLFILAFFYPWMDILPRVAFGSLLLLAALDYLLLYARKEGIFARRITPERLSNGDDNSLQLYIENRYAFPIHVGVIDEIPFQFQKRDIWFRLSLSPRQEKKIEYSLRPTKRGSYSFGRLNVFARTSLGLLMRRYNFDQGAEVPVYPSYLQMRKYQLLAISNRLSEIGIKKTRRIGHSMEFEQIKEYVQGDDYRTVNWKATARRG